MLFKANSLLSYLIFIFKPYLREDVWKFELRVLLIKYKIHYFQSHFFPHLPDDIGLSGAASSPLDKLFLKYIVKNTLVFVKMDYNNVKFFSKNTFVRDKNVKYNLKLIFF